MSCSLRNLEETASSIFGWKELRPGQLTAMDAVVNGRSALCVMPTGFGKSAIYQVPAMVLPGVVVVVSPLIAQQHDQAEAINESTGTRRAYVMNSDLSDADREEAWAAASDPDESRRAKFLFLAPEQTARDDVAKKLRSLDVSLLVIDEAHCVSAWGHDFRPDYLQLGSLVRSLNCPALALTTTASTPVQQEIAERLRVESPLTLVTGFDRPNLFLQVEQHTDAAWKRKAVVEQVHQLQLPGLIYSATRRAAELLAAELSDAGLRADSYHSGRRKSDREQVHAAFLDGGLDVVVATTAFGMGIDKPNVRFVLHENVADSLDSYYQEIGRAGRDGLDALAWLHYRPEDLSLRRFFAAKSADPAELAQLFAVLRAQDRPVTVKELRDLSGLSQRKLAGLLNLLELAGMIEDGTGGYTAGDHSTKAAVQAAVEQAEHRELIDQSRVEMMRRYAETRTCRRQFLLAFFGDELDGPCGNCDNCAGGVSKDVSSVSGVSGVSHGASGGASGDADSTDAAKYPYALQSRVQHSKWGPGVVMGYEEGTVTVLFESVGYRTLSVELVEEKGLLAEAPA
ncbi:RecQ family ATP-dependent DNA helicase [Arthrobacter sp. Br18]|uniref:RecQ family ATP-dependent DNA helicase n=1 Tax=Arthrobacter sp. Br18 TaxID=1312954 RepID=UPI00047A0F47|nr:RecQ family ATP-dependent DNA helicase [Arthrobacter sp. Br18]